MAGIDNVSAPFVYGSLMGGLFQNYQSEDKPVASLLSGYEYLVAVIEDPPGTYCNKVYGQINRVASGFRSAIDNADVFGWTSASASTTHLIQRNGDGTCSVFENTTLSDPAAAIDVSSWSGIIQVAAAPNAVFGRKSDGTVVASGLTAGWCDLDQLDGLFVDSIVACNHAQRVAFHIDRS